MAAVIHLLSTLDEPSWPKICLFIDGLDEYEKDSDHLELCHALLKISKSPNIKICLSSRPWPVFEDSFGSDPTQQLHMQNLTHDDIQSFARDELQKHPRWTAPSYGISNTDKTKLIADIAERAEGVFLWAFLVTRSLRDGLSNEDTITDMRRRLATLPTDLEKLFKHMLGDVDPIYHTKMAGMLQVAMHAFNPLHVDIYWHLEKGFEHERHAFDLPIGISREMAELQMQREQTRRRINARTKGLLEARDDRVEFLHRTVRDFLLTQHMSDFLLSRLQPGFNVHYSISVAYLAFLKSSIEQRHRLHGILRPAPGQNGGNIMAYLNAGLSYAAQALNNSPISDRNITNSLLDHYELSLSGMLEQKYVTMDGPVPALDSRLPFREEVLKHDLTLYLEKKVSEVPDYLSVFNSSPIYSLFTPMVNRVGPERSTDSTANMLQIVMDHGLPDIYALSKWANPLEPKSPWMLALGHWPPKSHAFWRCCMQFAARGADPDAPYMLETIFFILVQGRRSLELDEQPLTQDEYFHNLEALVDRQPIINQADLVQLCELVKVEDKVLGLFICGNKFSPQHASDQYFARACSILARLVESCPESETMTDRSGLLDMRWDVQQFLDAKPQSPDRRKDARCLLQELFERGTRPFPLVTNHGSGATSSSKTGTRKRTSAAWSPDQSREKSRRKA